MKFLTFSPFTEQQNSLPAYGPFSDKLKGRQGANWVPCCLYQHLQARFRPLESIPLQPFMPQAKSVTIPIQYFHYRPGPVVKSKQMARKRIKIQLIFYKNRHSVNGLPHVGYAHCQIYFDSCMAEDHRHPSRVAIIWASVRGVKPSGTSILNLLPTSNFKPEPISPWCTLVGTGTKNVVVSCRGLSFFFQCMNE